MSNLKKYSLIAISIIMLILDITINKDISISMLTILISLSLIKRNIVLYVALLFVFLQISDQILTRNMSILSVLNGLIFCYLIYINWSNMEGKTFNRWRDTNIKSMIILSAILQCIMLIPTILITNIDWLNILAFALTWMSSMALFIGFFFFCIRSTKTFDWYLIAGGLMIIEVIFNFLIFNSINIPRLIMALLFILFNAVIVIKK